MAGTYIEYEFTITPPQPGTEILIAELSNLDFDSFVETETGLKAYIRKEDWHSGILKEVYILSAEEFDISIASKEIAQENWNQRWEESFEPIEVDARCTVRAPFHPTPSTEFDIVIEPKMSFGTGHHETTHMMIQHMLSIDLEGRKVLDMGSGTGVLAILAEKQGATTIDAVDIDEWCFLNAIENAERNQCQHITVQQGGIEKVVDGRYDSILANINRNVLLEQIPHYATMLEPNGTLLLSGFYTEDIEMISQCCHASQLAYDSQIVKNNWVSMRFAKK